MAQPNLDTQPLPNVNTQPLASFRTTPQRLVCAAQQMVVAHRHHPAAYLVPLRIFMGLGWLRAGAEKLLEGDWARDPSLSAFLTRQLNGGHVAFPLYEWLITTLVLPNVAVLEWMIVIGQFLVGFALLFGVFTNGVLLGAVLMNVNFLLVGRVNPNAFYIVIQVILLLGQSGQVFGVDAWLSRCIRTPLLVAQPPVEGPHGRMRPLWAVGGALVCLTLAVSAVPFIRDFTAVGSVEDPALFLVILGGLGALWSGLAYFRHR